MPQASETQHGGGIQGVKPLLDIYGPQVWTRDPGSVGGTPPKLIEKKRVKIPWDFLIQSVIRLDLELQFILVVDNHQRTAVVVDVDISNDDNIRKKEYEKLRRKSWKSWKKCGV